MRNVAAGHNGMRHVQGGADVSIRKNRGVFDCSPIVYFAMTLHVAEASQEDGGSYAGTSTDVGRSHESHALVHDCTLLDPDSRSRLCAPRLGITTHKQDVHRQTPQIRQTLQPI